MSEERVILVIGATGKQGGGVINALLSLPTLQGVRFKILALARDPSSSAAQKLSQHSQVSIIQGDLNDSAAIFAKHYAKPGAQPIWGVFSVQINSDKEIDQGKGVVDAARTHGVKHFVYASGDRGGPEKSAWDQTKVKNFAAKFTLEKYLEEAVASTTSTPSPMTFTILRPVTFFENQTPDIHGKGFMRMFMQLNDGQKKLQMISTRDIGFFAAQAFAHSDDGTYRNAALSIAGDELTAREAEQIFKEVTGKDLPMAPCLVGKALKTFLRDTVGDMFEWFEKEGYGADVKACRAANPDMLDYRTWLIKYSGFA